MPAADYRHPITIRQKSTAKDAEGRVVPGAGTPTTILSTRAAVEDLYGKDYFQAAAANTELTTLFRIRYHPTVAALKPPLKHDILYGTRIFDIVSIMDPKGRRRELHLMCKET